MTPVTADRATAVLEASGMLRASEKSVVEVVLGRRPGVTEVEANPAAQTVTVSFDPAQTSVAELRRWVTECGYHCAGQSVPSHVCDPLLEARPAELEAVEARPPEHAPPEHGHAEMSMAAMVADMRNRFWVAARLLRGPLAGSAAAGCLRGRRAQCPGQRRSSC